MTDKERLNAIAKLTRKLDFVFIARQDKRHMWLCALIEKLATGSDEELQIIREKIEKELSTED